MATFSDNLDGTAGDLLSARSGWSRTIGVDNAAIITGGSGVALGASGGGASTGTWHVPSSQPTGNDQYVEAYLGAVNQAFPLGVRCDTSIAAGGGYLARCTAANVIELYRRSAAGVLLSLGSYTVPTPSDLLTNKVRLEVVGTDITVSFKGSVVIGPITRTDFASGSVAMLSRGGTPSTTVYTVDDWQSGDVGAATQTLTPSLFTNSQTFYAPTVTRGAVALTPVRFDNAQTFYSAAVANTSGPQSLTPARYNNSQTFYGPTITLIGGPQTLMATRVNNTQAFFTPVVAQASPQALAASLLVNTQVFYTPAVAFIRPARTPLVTGGAWRSGFQVTGGARSGSLSVTGGNWVDNPITPVPPVTDADYYTDGSGNIYTDGSGNMFIREAA